MIDRNTINGQIQLMINQSISQIPRPEIVTIKKVYTGNGYVDVETENDETLTRIPIIANTPTVNDKAVLIYLTDDKMTIIGK